MRKTGNQQPPHAAKKIVFITALLVDNSEAYEGKTNADIEREILQEIGLIPYVAQIEKVTVLNFEHKVGKKGPC